MKKQHKLLITSLLMLLCGWLSGGIGYASSRLPFNLNAVLFFGGLLLIIGGIITFILSLSTNE